MSNKFNLKKSSFLIYGLGTTGQSVIKYLKRKKISNYYTWEDINKPGKKFSNKNIYNLIKILKKVDYIVLSPGISLKKTRYKKILSKFKKKIITDIDLLYLTNNNFKSIVVTGTNGKSTTCKIIAHLLKKNKYKVELGGNIGTPVLNLKIKNKTIFIIEASSYQLSHSKFIHPSYAILLNITNDHIDWHGSMKHYTNSKLKIFNLQQKKNFAFINNKFKDIYKKKKYLGKLILVKIDTFKKKIKAKIDNKYINSKINNENMDFVYAISKLFKISNKSFIQAINTFVGLPHRYEIFLKRKNNTFINDSKATSFEATKYALTNSKNIYWIVGGLPKYNDKMKLRRIKNNIIKSYIIGKNVNYFKQQIRNKVNFSVTKNLKNSIIKILKDIKLFKTINNTILLSPSAASFDQFKNFETRGIEFKKLSKIYAKKFI